MNDVFYDSLKSWQDGESHGASSSGPPQPMPTESLIIPQRLARIEENQCSMRQEFNQFTPFHAESVGVLFQMTSACARHLEVDVSHL